MSSKRSSLGVKNALYVAKGILSYIPPFESHVLEHGQTQKIEHTLIDCGQEMQTHCTLSKALLKSIAYPADLLDPIN